MSLRFTYERKHLPLLRSFDSEGELDAAHDAYVELVAGAPQRKPVTIAALVARTRFRALDEIRRARRRSPAYLAQRFPYLSDASGYEPGQCAERSVAVEAALGRLPTEYRDVIQLFFFDQQTVFQVSRTLGLSVAAVYKRRSEALARLACDKTLRRIVFL